MRQLQRKVLGNRFRTNKREYSFIKALGKLWNTLPQDAVLSQAILPA